MARHELCDVDNGDGTLQIHLVRARKSRVAGSHRQRHARRIQSQCLSRRIDNIETIRSEVAVWQARRDNLQTKVNWQFTTKDARVKLKRLGPTTCS